MASPCVACNEPLVFPNEDGVEVPDDLQLTCGCHFHWQVPFPALSPKNLRVVAPAVASTLKCPSCGQNVASSSQVGAGSSSSAAAASETHQILTRYINESGLQEGYDIYSDIAEEAYYSTYPQFLRARPFLAMCSEGHVEGIIELCQEADTEEEDGDDDDEMEDDDGPSVPAVRSAALLRYQDPLNQMATGLHVAIANDQINVAYLLLYLSSHLPMDQFPPDLLQFAAQIGRPEQAILENADIRSLQTAQGETAEVLALRKGGLWAEMAQRGLFSV
ncbi:hypothetical protein Sste5346_000590 [Sporothrix stenoceras]|uniref:Uncharacterized protein n=1 Tax=Sporothrix stenoceras TaxID=5173 RepID=A0ABR3ZS88_9PEZI